LLRVVDISKSYGAHPVLEKLSFCVPEESVTALLGPNGAGKTTTIKIITGLLRANSGTVYLNDNPVTSDSKTDLSAILGYVPDSPFLYDHLTGLESLEFVRQVRGLGDDTFDFMLSLAERFEIRDQLNKLTLSYSFGMKRKLSIISALMHTPSLLVLDEPTVGLDPKAIRSLKDIFKEHCDHGGAVFMSTHLLASAQEICDRVLILQKGKIVLESSVEEVGAVHVGDLERLFLELTDK
jgi:ABC-2 type transport system ATP-binding protein